MLNAALFEPVRRDSVTGTLSRCLEHLEMFDDDGESEPGAAEEASRHLKMVSVRSVDSGLCKFSTDTSFLRSRVVVSSFFDTLLLDRGLSVFHLISQVTALSD